MLPEICTIGPFTIYSYGLMLVVAFLVATTLACRRAKQENYNPDTVFNLLFLTFVSGVAGARIFYVIQNWHYYLKNPLEIIMLQHGGLSWFGGLILGVFSAVFYLRVNKLSLYKTLDMIVPFVALAQSIGRIGCLLNGCCFGKASVYGIYFPVHKAVLIPTQLYSSIILILIFVILRLLQDKPHKEGAIFFTYLLLYSIKRFFIEFWRADNEIIFSGLTLFQILSIAVFCVAVFKLICIIKSQK